MPMKTPWEALVEKLGLEGARAEMARRRSFVEKPVGLANVGMERRKEISKMGVEARKAKRGN